MKRLIPLAIALSFAGVAPVMAQTSSTMTPRTQADCAKMADGTLRMQCENQLKGAMPSSTNPARVDSGGAAQQPGAAGTSPGTATRPNDGGSGGNK